MIKAAARQLQVSIPTLYALVFAVCAVSWGIYRQFEVYINPVVTDFEILKVEHHEDHTMIYGSFNKRRDCEFKSVLAYDGPQFLSLDFMHTSGERIVSRIPKIQYFGPWKLTPRADNLELYTRHKCSTGAVVSQHYSGPIKVTRVIE